MAGSGASPAGKTDAAAEAAPAGKKKLPIKMIAVAAGVVILELGTVLFTVKVSSGPKRALAESPASQPAPEVEKVTEVPIVDAKLPNNQTGHLYLYDLEVDAKVAVKNKEKVTALLTERQAEVKDRIRTIIASADPKNLNEPGLETLRRQISYQLEQDLGPDLIKELLIPKCTPFRAEF